MIIDVFEGYWGEAGTHNDDHYGSVAMSRGMEVVVSGPAASCYRAFLPASRIMKPAASESDPSKDEVPKETQKEDS